MEQYDVEIPNSKQVTCMVIAPNEKSMPFSAKFANTEIFNISGFCPVVLIS
jgi:hypothetical protein